jgi:3-hydroxyisobutyrate dehydrogenase-like beta-hydroxyacid dehydrogenase
VAVVGAGTMGVGISHVFATNGIATVLVDATPQLSQAARERSLSLLERLAEAGTVAADRVATAERHLSAAASIADAVQGAELVVEAVVERADVKTSVYETIEASAADAAVIATNTSSIPIAELAAGLRRRVDVHGRDPVRREGVRDADAHRACAVDGHPRRPRTHSDALSSCSSSSAPTALGEPTSSRRCSSAPATSAATSSSP